MKTGRGSQATPVGAVTGGVGPEGGESGVTSCSFQQFAVSMVSHQKWKARGSWAKLKPSLNMHVQADHARIAFFSWTVQLLTGKGKWRVPVRAGPSAGEGASVRTLQVLVSEQAWGIVAPELSNTLGPFGLDLNPMCLLNLKLIQM